MIIKKLKALSLLQQAAPAPVKSEPGIVLPEALHYGTEATLDEPSKPVDVYAEMVLSSEVFEAGRLPDRRQGPRNERRGGYRRLADQEVISQAHEEANAIREAAAEEGFQQGLTQAEETLAELVEAIQLLLNAREDAILSVSKELGEMAVDIAEGILKTEVSCDETLVVGLVRNTLGKVGRDQKSIMLKVHPMDLSLVKAALKEDSGLSLSVEILVSEDATVDPGSCMVESRAGQIDARFKTQLETIRHLLRLKTGGA